ncbi:MAG: metal-dependent hydrolase [Alphaproteobacteria bacterium]|nr:metal-dependent hydrolase [Alphaproteobacteria bacterium]
MADFRTHLIGGALLGVAAAVVAGATGTVPLTAMPALVAIGAAGGLAPDVDSDTGRPQRILFNTGAVLLPSALLWRVPWLSETLPRALLGWALVAFVVWGPLRYAFRKLTVHRGALHSIPAALICGGSTFLVAGRRVDDTDLQLAIGLTAAAGFVVHLVLDELWAVDFNGVRFKPKASLGSALSLRGPTVTTTVLLYLTTGFVAGLVWQNLHGRRVEELWDRYHDHPAVVDVTAPLRRAWAEIEPKIP